MNTVGEIYNMKKSVCREMDIPELHGFILAHRIMVMSWGFQKPTKYKNLCYQFKVNGHHHKGIVSIVLDWSDTFTIYYISPRKQEIKKVREMVYIDQLIDILDKDIEYISEYSQ